MAKQNLSTAVYIQGVVVGGSVSDLEISFGSARKK